MRNQKKYYEKFKLNLPVFFSSNLVDGTVANVTSDAEYGGGRAKWDEYSRGQTAGQYLNLNQLFKDPAMVYPSAHFNLCGELAVLAALNFDLIEGMKVFMDLPLLRIRAKNNGEEETYTIHGSDILRDRTLTTSTSDLIAFINALLGQNNSKYERAVYPRTKDDFNKFASSGKPMLALVNLNKHTKLIQGATQSASEVPHWVTILNMTTNLSGEKIVLVYNPYNNQQEYYNWTTFEAAWKATYFDNELNSSYVYIKPGG